MFIIFHQNSAYYKTTVNKFNIMTIITKILIQKIILFFLSIHCFIILILILVSYIIILLREYLLNLYCIMYSETV